MRTIKFRAKNLDGEWVYGFYVEEDRQTLNGFEKKYLIVNDDGHHYVKPETVGQFTGLYDKNGKEIYEGDIIIEKLRRARIDGEKLVICFDDFEWQGKNANGVTTSLSLLVEYHTIEVIGNIHDNPELLKGGEQ